VKLYVKAGRIKDPKAVCDQHRQTPAMYSLQILAFDTVVVNRKVCEACLCRHFRLELYFSVEEGMKLPAGLMHKVVR